jgi:uncharacterized protein with LGFP repeats
MENEMTTQKETGGAAFPVYAQGDPRYTDEKGLSIRDYFAAKAMQGFNKGMCDYGWDAAVLTGHARMAYAIADAMLEDRK